MNSRLDAIVDWEELAFLARYRVAELAAKVGCCARTLQHYIRDRFLKAAHLWLTELRMKRAVEFLKTGRAIKEIARGLGFSFFPFLAISRSYADRIRIPVNIESNAHLALRHPDLEKVVVVAQEVAQASFSSVRSNPDAALKYRQFPSTAKRFLDVGFFTEERAANDRPIWRRLVHASDTKIRALPAFLVMSQGTKLEKQNSADARAVNRKLISATAV